MVRSALFGGREESIKLKKSSFEGVRGDGRTALSNAELSPYGLRAHRLFQEVNLSGIPSNIRAIKAYGDRLLLFNMESGYFGIYVLSGGTVSKTGTTVKTYPLDSDGSDYCTTVLMTDDGHAKLDGCCAHTKLLFFPSGQTACLSSAMIPMLYSTLPTDIPTFRYAALSKGRLYGSEGQKVYVSGAGGCFDWTYDTQGEDPSAEHAWKGATGTQTDRSMEVTALMPYKNGVLVFRERALQVITGNENPFVLKDLFKVGTKYGGSVKEVDGKIYFLTDRGPACYNGSTVDYLPPLPQGIATNGVAGELDGRYCIYGTDGVFHHMYSYDEKSKSYAVCKVPQEVRELVNCNGSLYALMGGVGEESKLYLLTEDRSSSYMEAEFSLLDDEYRRVSVRDLAVRLNVSAGSSFRVTVKQRDQNGKTVNCSFDMVHCAAGGVLTYRIRKRIRSSYGVRLLVESVGDVTLGGFEIVYNIAERGGS